MNSLYETVDPIVWSDWFYLLLQTISATGQPPTHASRFLFLLSVLAHDVVGCIHPDLPLKDDFQTLGKFASMDPYLHKDLWLEQGMVDALRLLYMSMNLPMDTLDQVIRKHAQTYPNIYETIQSNDGMNVTRIQYQQRIQKYLDLRSQDGSKDAQQFVPAKGYPNAGQYIQTNEGQDLAHDLKNPQKWCGLHIVYDNGTKEKYQSYLTPQWGNVRGVLAHDTSRTITEDVGRTFFPSPSQHQQEIKDVLEMCQNLSEKDKMIAEFWAGGPNTCTPPGFWFLFSVYASRCHRLSIVRQVELYYQMGACLFEAGICAWRLKRKYLQERPIQAIRKLRPLRDVRLPDGSTASNDLWVPFQASNFVTPPFPDFVSGHSTFSAVGCRVLTEFFGTNVIPTNYKFPASDVRILSPILQRTDPTCNMCQIHIYPRTSEITSARIPTTGITLGWTSWDQMADEAGKSRLYGGIHYESSNQGGLALGRLVFHHLFEN